MIRWNTPLVRAVVASAIVAMPLIAQKQDKAAPADKCTIPTDKPDEVKTAMTAITVAQIGGKPADQQKKLANAVTALTGSPSKYSKNQIGRDYVLGQALTRFAAQFPESATVSKSTLGYVEGKDQRVDILAAADTAFTAVETANPDCVEETQGYRNEAMRPYAVRVSNALNGDSVAQADSAVKRMAAISPKSPLTYYFQGQLAQRRKDVAAAADLYAKGAAALPPTAGADSNLRVALELGSAQMTLLSAQSMTGDAKKTGMLKAADLYKKFLADFPNSPQSPSAQAGLTAALGASGDTQSVGKLWDDMAANPTKYSDAQLYDAGTQAFTANQPAAASKLMDAAQQQNPWLRQGLYNAANVYWKAGSFDKMLPAAKRLTVIDPNNPDEYQLLALAYQGMAKASKDPKVSKAYNDSLNAAFASSEKVPVRVVFDQFSGSGSPKRTLSGTVENLGTAPKTVTLKLDFLDAKGAVVATQSTPITLAPKEKKPFSVSGDGATIAATSTIRSAEESG